MTNKVITLDQLRALNACESQLKLFQETFGDSVKLTKAIAKRYASSFEIDWAARKLLSATARAAYKEATATALAAYDKALAPAEAAYNEATAPARAAYKEAKALSFYNLYDPTSCPKP